MRSVASYLLTMVVVILFFLHIGTTFMDKISGTMPDEVFTKSMIFAFVLLLCIVLVVRRSVIGGILYIIANTVYYGMEATSAMSTMDIVAIGTAALPIIFSIVVLLELLYAKVKQKSTKKDSKTDWYYSDENYDRKFDEREDRNNYKF